MSIYITDYMYDVHISFVISLALIYPVTTSSVIILCD